MFVLTKSNMKLSNGNTGHSQLIGVILCCFTNYSIIYPVVPVYYFPGHPYKIIPLGALKCNVGLKNVTSEPLDNFDFVET